MTQHGSATCGPHVTASYRTRIYDRYVSAFKGRPDPEQAGSILERRGPVFDALLGPLFDDLRPKQVLEAGCGQGSFLLWAAHRGVADAHGFDRAAEQVEIARSLGLSAEIATATDYFSRCRREYDLIVAFDLIEHFTRDEALDFLGCCRVCLRPGGVLFLTTPNGSALRPGPVAYGDLTHETIFTPGTMRLFLELTGYEQVNVHEIQPPPASVRSRVRRVLWKILRLGPALVDLIETGGQPTRVYSRVMAVHARRPPSSSA